MKIKKKISIILFAFICSFCSDQATITIPSEKNTAPVKDARKIRDELFKCNLLVNKNHSAIHSNLLKGINFQQADSRTIPPLALSTVKQINSALKTERELFLKHIIAAVKCVNKIIMEHRELVNFVNKKGVNKLSESQKRKFYMICDFYKTSNLKELLYRVAPVPISLAAAQAALESGFGSNHYIHIVNGYFGMMKDSKHLYSFDTVFESVIAYTKTLNVNRS
ncbi:MAG: glucosaminidase domain-containing protein, partial [Alphaproteobacteria bacterium]|nr:glucosaminidase domain-containing protein [Alphaproteobacteria bacterium]